MRICEGDCIDLLICDLGLPDGDSWHLLAELRRRSVRKAIALSGFGMAADIEHSRAAGIDVHLTKPVQFAQLMETVRQLAGGGPSA